jgi:acetylornithine aminotransferase
MGAISLTGQSGKRDQFRPILPKIKYLPFGDFKSILMIRRKTAMVFLEPIMGEAGVIVPPPGYLRAVRERCDEVGALLTMDCIQTGIGRTGEWFGFEDEGIKPDVITIAKGIGGGLPLGAMIALGKSAELFTPGSHGSTFGGNPIACAAANVVLDEISNKNMLRSNKLKGDLLKRLISAIPGVVEVRGKGLLVGIEVEEQRAKEIAADLLKRGFLVNSANESVIRIAPGYLITERNIETFATTLRKVCRQIYD